MTHKTLRLTLPLVTLCTLAAISCKKADEPAATGGYQPGVTGAAGAAPTAAPTVTAAPTATAAPAPTAPAAPDPALAAAAAPLLVTLAKTQVVAGSKELGTPLLGNVGGAVVLEQAITLQPKKCYSVVAASMGGVTELNVQLVQVTPIPALAPVLAVDQDTGPNATLGKKPTCFTWQLLIPTPAKVVVSAAGGQGFAGAQIFEK